MCLVWLQKPDSGVTISAGRLYEGNRYGYGGKGGCGQRVGMTCCFQHRTYIYAPALHKTLDPPPPRYLVTEWCGCTTSHESAQFLKDSAEETTNLPNSLSHGVARTDPPLLVLAHRDLYESYSVTRYVL